ncbi:VOC family protein [Brevirhabdus sp.]|uniref:VOC family protein n=1 Tax=Brevirhabdus sp. TaxID=2004514 RepID=UPI004058B017
MKANRVTLITLGVADLARARAYYERLGWVPQEALDEVAFYDMGGARFGLFSLEGLAREQGCAVADLGRGAATLAQNFPDREGVDAAWQAAVAAGARAIAAPVATEWGGYSGYVADPDGHVWEFAMNPFWPLDADGRLA